MAESLQQLAEEVGIPVINLSMASARLPLRAVEMPLYPTMGSLQEVVDFADSKLPITDKNEMLSLLMTYHNTLLQEIDRVG